MSTPNPENYVLGRGSLFWSPYDAAGNMSGGERHLGNATEVMLSMNVERLDHFSSMSGLKAKDKSVVSQVGPQMAFTLEEFVADNWKMLVFGSSEEVAQLAGKTDFVIATPEKGRYYDLGKLAIQATRLNHGTVTNGPFTVGETVTGAPSTATAEVLSVGAGFIMVSPLTGTFAVSDTVTGSSGTTNHPTATLTTAPVVQVGAVVAKATTGGTLYASPADYIVDGRTGRFHVTADSTIMDSVTVSFSYAAKKYTRIKGLTALNTEGQLRFVSDNPEGGNYSLVAWRCNAAPAAETGLISEDWGNMQFTADILRDLTNHPDSPYLDLHIYAE